HTLFPYTTLFRSGRRGETLAGTAEACFQDRLDADPPGRQLPPLGHPFSVPAGTPPGRGAGDTAPPQCAPLRRNLAGTGRRFPENRPVALDPPRPAARPLGGRTHRVAGQRPPRIPGANTGGTGRRIRPAGGGPVPR